MYKNSFNCADVRMGDTVLSQKASNRKGAPRSRSPSEILDVGDKGVTAKFQGRTFKVERYGARKKVDAQDAGDVDGDPASRGPDTWGGLPPAKLGEPRGANRRGLG